MHRAVSLLVLTAVVTAAVAFADSRSAAEEQLAVQKLEVRKVIADAYVDGIHNFRDPVAIRKGFHPDFEMLVLREGKLEKLPLEEWIAKIEAGNRETPPPSRDSGLRSTEASFPVVEVTGKAAICKVELSRDGNKIFTDYLSLYRFDGGWKIVGKIFHRHPEAP